MKFTPATLSFSAIALSASVAGMATTPPPSPSKTMNMSKLSGRGAFLARRYAAFPKPDTSDSQPVLHKRRLPSKGSSHLQQMARSQRLAKRYGKKRSVPRNTNSPISRLVDGIPQSLEFTAAPVLQSGLASPLTSGLTSGLSSPLSSGFTSGLASPLSPVLQSGLASPLTSGLVSGLPSPLTSGLTSGLSSPLGSAYSLLSPLNNNELFEIGSIPTRIVMSQPNKDQEKTLYALRVVDLKSPPSVATDPCNMSSTLQSCPSMTSIIPSQPLIPSVPLANSTTDPVIQYAGLPSVIVPAEVLSRVAEILGQSSNSNTTQDMNNNQTIVSSIMPKPMTNMFPLDQNMTVVSLPEDSNQNSTTPVTSIAPIDNSTDPNQVIDSVTSTVEGI